MSVRCLLSAIVVFAALGCGNSGHQDAVSGVHEVDAQRVDLGVQQLDTIQSHMFAVSNRTGRELKIGSYQSSCECVVLEIENPVVSPDSEAVLRCILDANNGFAGEFAFEVALQDTTGAVNELPFVLLIRFVNESPLWSALTLVESK